MSDDMRGLFFIVKGQYSKGVEPKFINSVSGDDMFIGGYDPESPFTAEWYMLMDKHTYTVVCCGSDINKVVKGVYTLIKKFKGNTKKYLRQIEESDTKMSKVMVCMYEHIYQQYGDYYRDIVEKQEERAFSELKEDRPVFKNRRLVSKMKNTGVVEVIETPVKEVFTPPSTPKKVPPKVHLGVKKLKMV